MPRTAHPILMVTRRLPPAVEQRLLAAYEARLNLADLPRTEPELLAAAEGADAILVCPADRLPARVIEALPASIRIIASFSVGTDHIDLEAARRRGIVVTNTPDVLTEATAEIAILLMLGAARRAAEGERMVRAEPGTPGAWTGWTPTQLMGIQVSGRRLAILGMGRIGRAVAARARGFGMEIHYHNRKRLPPEQEQGATFHPQADDLLPLADVLSFHCPATPETHHWLNAARIERLPQPVVVVNTARGAVVEDEALIAALGCGRISAAGLDVYEGEPALHPGYRTLPNTFLLPHLGSATIETRNAMGFRVLDNLDAFFRGETPRDRVA